MDILKFCKYQELTFIFHHAEDCILEFLHQQACPNCSIPLNLAIIKQTNYMPNQCSLRRCVHAHSKGGYRLGRTEKAVSNKSPPLLNLTDTTVLKCSVFILYCLMS